LDLGAHPKGCPSFVEREVMGKMGLTHWIQKSPHGLDPFGKMG